MQSLEIFLMLSLFLTKRQHWYFLSASVWDKEWCDKRRLTITEGRFQLGSGCITLFKDLNTFISVCLIKYMCD